MPILTVLELENLLDYIDNNARKGCENRGK